MIITRKGHYRLLEDIKVRNSITIGTLPKGTAIEITQVDNVKQKVIGEQLLDWTHWDLPVENIN
ncbi:hypothetical protein MTAT_26540 [Moorella thermoacetica]|uniref:Uncharacterized protein n=1 Tax=Neomoorella thermoacetica TaxID=1525 RepID=A0AAC9HG49_NEOTH|nr:hypothetical protein [Moorella thermoacetica]AOQ23043.1 hypothetical protein Maut_00580 [Moorella thermoacetica]TYL08990.1 hypothetical protein MTAT_26540 [Moorella thermoacetica]